MRLTGSIFPLLATLASSVMIGRRSFSVMALNSRACFGAGCYWGTGVKYDFAGISSSIIESSISEKFFKADFGKKLKPGSVKSGAVGFMSADPSAVKNPSYRAVCTGTTKHVEVYDLEFDGDEQTYEQLVKHFYMFHDPTTKDRQGNDRGTQYASAIFCYDDKQVEIATRVTAELQELLKKGKVQGYSGNTVTTAITRESTFYPAEEDHQEYLEKNPWGYCNHGYRFKQWPSL